MKKINLSNSRADLCLRYLLPEKLNPSIHLKPTGDT